VRRGEVFSILESGVLLFFRLLFVVIGAQRVMPEVLFTGFRSMTGVSDGDHAEQLDYYLQTQGAIFLTPWHSPSYKNSTHSSKFLPLFRLFPPSPKAWPHLKIYKSCNRLSTESILGMKRFPLLRGLHRASGQFLTPLTFAEADVRCIGRLPSVITHIWLRGSFTR
jgi:hypothetical protein